MRGLATILLLCTIVCVTMATEEKREENEAVVKIRACGNMESFAPCKACCQGETWEEDVLRGICVDVCKDAYLPEPCTTDECDEVEADSYYY